MEKNIKKIYMRKGSKGILKCIMTFILAVAMMTGAVPEMNLTAHASSYYTTYLVTSEDTDQTLPDKVVHFNNYDWYIIADNSTALDAGTITLFAKDNIGNSKFNPRYYGNSYNGSTIKGYLDNLISTTFLDMSDAIVSVDLQDVNVTGVKLWLLSTSETEGLNINIRKCSSNWWLRTPVSSSVMGIDGGNGGFFNAQYLPDVDMLLGVRPALKLDLSKAEFNSATKTFSAIGQTVSVTNVNLEPSTPQTIAVGDTVSFTASITPNEATDKTVKWKIGGTDAGALKLYTDAACETPLGTDATEVMTVYAKGISTGNAIVTCLSNSDSAKFASCEVTVNTLQTQIEEVLTTITATGIGQASYSTNNVANVLVNNSSFNDACGWNGTDMSIEVSAADGYTITRCVFYDDANHIATDSVSPFKAETHHLDTIPYVNSDPIYEGSRGIKKIDVIGYYTGNSVTITPGSNMTKTMDSGDALQNGLTGAMTAVVYTANEGYYFPTDYNAEDINGISVTRDSYTQITVSGTPTADAEITLAEPTAKTKPDAPTTATAVGCTTIDNNDGKITGITTDMEYKKSGAESWTGGTGSDITRLVGVLQLLYSLLDVSLVSTEFVTILVEEGLGLEDHGVSLIHFVDTLTLTFVVLGILLGLSLHAIDFILRQSAGSFDSDSLLFACGLVFGADLQDTVGVDIECHFNLRHSAACRGNAGEVELSDGFVLAGHGALSLQNMDGDLRLVVSSSRESLALLARNSGVGLYQLGHHASECFDAQCQRCHVEQHDVTHAAFLVKYGSLNGSTDGHDLIGVHAL